MKRLVDNSSVYTDKGVVHSYLPLYEKLLNPITDSAINILEIGIGDFRPKNGGSVLMWLDFFEQAQIHAIDTLPEERVDDTVLSHERSNIYCEQDAYDEAFVQTQFRDKNIQFDFVLDDGSHCQQHQVKFIELYHDLLTPNGILIIEDVQEMDWLDTLTDATPDHLKEYIKVYDLREEKGRYDDIVFTIDKTNSQ